MTTNALNERLNIKWLLNGKMICLLEDKNFVVITTTGKLVFPKRLLQIIFVGKLLPAALSMFNGKPFLRFE